MWVYFEPSLKDGHFLISNFKMKERNISLRNCRTFKLLYTGI